MRNQNELMHHSVKGIKWGVRKKQKVSGRQIRREYRDSIRRNHKQIKKDIPFYRPYKRELARIEKDASSAEKIVRKYGNLRGGSAVARQDAIDSLGSTLKKNGHRHGIIFNNYSRRKTLVANDRSIINGRGWQKVRRIYAR